MIHAKLTLLILCILLSRGGYAQAQVKKNRGQAQAKPAGQVIETGKFRFYETKQIRGEEDYTVSKTSDGELLVQAKTSMPFAGQDTKLS